MTSQPTWGVVATVKAPASDILDFAAHHLDLGARRVHVYLDAPCPEAEAALRAHPKCRVILCDDAYWRRRRKRAGRPAAHQPRQSLNATHCLTRRPGVDWLAHIDVDEFLWPATPLPAQLAALPADCLSARVRPVEALAPDPDDPPPGGTRWFKSCARLPGRRREETAAIYPGAGAHLDGGFLSHVAGKVFVRTGVPGTSLRIHNACAMARGTRTRPSCRARGCAICTPPAGNSGARAMPTGWRTAPTARGSGPPPPAATGPTGTRCCAGSRRRAARRRCAGSGARSASRHRSCARGSARMATCTPSRSTRPRPARGIFPAAGAGLGLTAGGG